MAQSNQSIGECISPISRFEAVWERFRPDMIESSLATIVPSVVMGVFRLNGTEYEVLVNTRVSSFEPGIGPQFREIGYEIEGQNRDQINEIEVVFNHVDPSVLGRLSLAESFSLTPSGN